MSAFATILQGDPALWPNPPAGKTALGFNQAGALCSKQSDGSVTVISGSGGGGTGGNAQASNAGTVTVTPGTAIWTEEVTLTGAQRTVPINVGVGGISAGARVFLKTIFPALPGGSIIQIFSNVTLIAQIQLDGLALNASFELYGQGGAWVLDKYFFPATA